MEKLYKFLELTPYWENDKLPFFLKKIELIEGSGLYSETGWLRDLANGSKKDFKKEEANLLRTCKKLGEVFDKFEEFMFCYTLFHEDGQINSSVLSFQARALGMVDESIEPRKLREHIRPYLQDSSSRAKVIDDLLMPHLMNKIALFETAALFHPLEIGPMLVRFYFPYLKDPYLFDKVYFQLNEKNKPCVKKFFNQSLRDLRSVSQKNQYDEFLVLAKYKTLQSFIKNYRKKNENSVLEEIRKIFNPSDFLINQVKNGDSESLVAIDILVELGDLKNGDSLENIQRKVKRKYFNTDFSKGIKAEFLDKDHMYWMDLAMMAKPFVDLRPFLIEASFSF